MADKPRLEEELIRFARQASEHDLVYLSCGNASLREDERMYVTCTGSKLGCLCEGDVSVLSLPDGEQISGPRPSIEFTMHCRAYTARPEIQAVLHTHAPSATVLSCVEDPPDDLNFVPEIPLQVGGHVYIDYANPGTEELAKSVGEALADPSVNVVQMRNHGQVVVGRNWAEAVSRAAYFERACWMALQGQRLRTIPKHLVENLSGYSRC